ncbi:butyrophilin subfamily 2 member A2-like isoform 3-T3 [Menidia menidia]
MSALRFLFLTLLLAVDSVLSAEGQTINKTAEPGQDVTLPCGARKENVDKIVLEWTKPGLDPDIVFYYRDGCVESEGQHPSFMNRVDLQDRQLKDGNMSLILKDVKINETGTYECKVQTKNDSVPQLISSVHLDIVPGTQERGDKEGGGSLGLTVGLTVVSLLCVFGVAAWICYRKRACLQRNSQHHPVDQREPDQL